MTLKEFKKILLMHVLGGLGAGLLKLLYATCKFNVVFHPDVERIKGKDVVLAFWHGDQLVMPYLRKYMCSLYGIEKFEVLISAHTDGRIIARAMRSFGIGSIEGSSTRGGRQALLEMLRKDDARQHAFVFTPDGPRGPRHKVKDGVIYVAFRTGRLIVPAAASASRAWRFRSWDKMMLPKPFSQVNIVVGEPLEVFDNEKGAGLLEERLNKLTVESNSACV